MKTVSVNVCNLCVPCENRCRHCLLSWDGKLRGVDYERSRIYAERFYNWIREKRPELSSAFYYGYSMEHPKLPETIDFARRIGSPGGRFLQFDGMKFRSDDKIRELLTTIQNHGVEVIDLTFYGTREYHDRFAARSGDYDYMLRILGTANQIGLNVNAGIVLNHENAGQLEALVSQLKGYQLSRLYSFVPHSEGRGATLNPVRFRQSDYEALPDAVRKLINPHKFCSERQWLLNDDFPEPQKRAVTLSLTPENVDFFENLGFAETIAYLEKLDDAYYAVVPTLAELAHRYGNREHEFWYSAYDLRLKYERQYLQEHRLKLYDIHDERQHFIRRF